MSTDQKPKLSRRQFAGAVAAGLVAPVLLGGAPAQEEKKPEAQKSLPPPEEERQSFLERGRKALREFPVPVETEPAFIFHARTISGDRRD